jgi:hypothetical protein
MSPISLWVLLWSSRVEMVCVGFWHYSPYVRALIRLATGPLSFGLEENDIYLLFFSLLCVFPQMPYCKW